MEIFNLVDEAVNETYDSAIRPHPTLPQGLFIPSCLHSPSSGSPSDDRCRSNIVKEDLQEPTEKDFHALLTKFKKESIAQNDHFIQNLVFILSRSFFLATIHPNFLSDRKGLRLLASKLVLLVLNLPQNNSLAIEWLYFSFSILLFSLNDENLNSKKLAKKMLQAAYNKCKRSKPENYEFLLCWNKMRCLMLHNLTVISISENQWTEVIYYVAELQGLLSTDPRLSNERMKQLIDQVMAAENESGSSCTECSSNQGTV
jgi:hypothetical protein